jgi:Zn finger protein HypA/HybF involved in hydrogenase expression
VLKTILIVQLAAPILLGIPIWIWSSISSSRRARRGARDGGSASGAQALAPLQCPNCSAPVPLQGEPFPCPSCRATVTPPPEYVRMLAMRKFAVAELARAERRWRWSRWTSSRLVTLPLALASMAWFALVVWAVIEMGWGRGVDIVALMTAGFLSGAGIASAFGLDAMGDRLPPLPAHGFMHPAAASASCRHCNAPIAFAEGELAAICPYCGGDNYRELLARVAQTDATTHARAANDSLLDAIRDLDERRDWLFSIIACAAAVEILYAVFALFGTVSDWLNSP